MGKQLPDLRHPFTVAPYKRMLGCREDSLTALVTYKLPVAHLEDLSGPDCNE